MKGQLASSIKFTLQYFNMLLTCPVFIHSGKKWMQTKVMVVFDPSSPPDVFIITGNWKEC